MLCDVVYVMPTSGEGSVGEQQGEHEAVQLRAHTDGAQLPAERRPARPAHHRETLQPPW